MVTPHFLDFFQDAYSAVEKKVIGEFANYFYFLFVLPVFRWLGKLFSRSQKRTENRRDLEALKLLYELDGSFGVLSDDKIERYKERYQELLAKSDDLKRVMPDRADEDPAAAPPSAMLTDDRTRMNVTDWIFALSAPALFAWMSVSDLTEGTGSPEDATILLTSSLIGAVISVLIARSWIVPHTNSVIWGAILLIIASIVSVFLGAILGGVLQAMLGIGLETS